MEASESHFEHIGYSMDFYFDGKYVGSRNCDKDREVYGYEGRKRIVIDEEIILRKKKYKAGTEFVTELYPLCGKSKLEPFITNPS